MRDRDALSARVYVAARRWGRRRLRPTGRTLGTAVALAIVLAGAALRLHRLAEVPPGLFVDQALYGLDAYRIAKGESFPVFVENPAGIDSGGREPLFMIVMAGVFALWGASPTTVKLTSALIGIATIPVVGWAASRFFGARVGLLAAALLALSRWHLTLSRIGFRAILVPLWVGLVVLALSALLRRRTAGAAVAFGAILGAGFYTYPAYWSVPLALAPVLGVALWERRRHGRRARPSPAASAGGAERATPGDVATGAAAPASPRRTPRALAALAALAFLLSLAPLLAHAAGRGGDMLARVRGTALVGGERAGAPAAPEVSLRDNLQRVAFMLHLRGDSEPRHNIPGKSMLDPLTGLAFLLGLGAIAAGRLPPQEGRGGSRDDLAARPLAAGLVLLWLVPLLPSALTHSAPHALRAIGALPAVCVIAALGLDAAARSVGRRFDRWGRVAGVALLAAAIAAAGALEVRGYFVEWAGRSDVAAGFTRDLPAFVSHLSGLARDADVVLCPYLYESLSVRFLTLERDPPFLPLDAGAVIAPAGARDRVFVCDEPAMNALLLRLYPEAKEAGRYAIHTARTGRILRVPAASLHARLEERDQELVRHFIARIQRDPSS